MKETQVITLREKKKRKKMLEETTRVNGVAVNDYKTNNKRSHEQQGQVFLTNTSI